MTLKVSTKEVSERMSQQWGPLKTTRLTYKGQEVANLRLLFMQLKQATDLLESITSSLLELELSQPELA